MSEANIADTKPVVMTLEAGDYWYCTCGNSDNQPFCNGAHQGTGFTPLKFTIEESKQVALCQCKQTGNEPFCDGSHAKL
ncbi:MAG: CDGSH iron-sulfur domain-containing protein [Cyanobacteria bacterium P01_F01_bin.86]